MAAPSRAPSLSAGCTGASSLTNTDCAGCMMVRNIEDVDRYMGRIRDAAAKIHAWIAAQTGDPLTCSGV